MPGSLDHVDLGAGNGAVGVGRFLRVGLVPDLILGSEDHLKRHRGGANPRIQALGGLEVVLGAGEVVERRVGHVAVVVDNLIRVVKTAGNVVSGGECRLVGVLDDRVEDDAV